MPKLILAVLFATACGGSPATPPASPAAPPVATAAATNAVFAIKDMMFYDGNDPAARLTKDGHIEVRSKHTENGGPTTVENKLVAVIAADGSVSDPTGTKRGTVGADGSFKSPQGEVAPFKLDNDTLVAQGSTVTIDDHGAVLLDSKPMSPPFRVEGVTDAASRRTALFVVAMLFTGSAVDVSPPTVTQQPTH